MLYSLLIKLAMLTVTMGLVFWVGWSMPQSSRYDGIAESSDPANRAAETAHDGDQRDTAQMRIPVTAPPVPLVRLQAAVSNLDLNQATERDLEDLPGIGPVLAKRIVQFRQSQGRFTGVEQLRKVKGIGSKTYDRIRNLVTVSIPAMPPSAGKRGT